MIEIDPSGDLIVKVTETGKDNNGQQGPYRTEEFRVQRLILITVSIPWRKMLGSGTYSEGLKDRIEFLDDHIMSTEIMFRALHDATSTTTYSASILDVWRLVGVVKKWQLLKIDFLKPWFAKWYAAQQYNKKELDLDEQRQLLFPCWRFDHPHGFATATRFLAYHVCHHIEEDNPSEFDDLHLPSRIISQLNAAKGRLRTILHRELYEPIEGLLSATCKCKAETLWGYEKALVDARVWPLEKVEKFTPMNAILSRLEKFTYKVAETACMSRCHRNYDIIARDAAEKTEEYFDGMCLDCMDRMKPKSGDRHSDYWLHNNFRAEDDWFRGCRIQHKQPSWYFSFMGRQADKDWLTKNERRPYDLDDDLW